MKRKATPLTKLRRSARCSLVCGCVLAVMFVILAGVSLRLRSTSNYYWQPDKVEHFKRDCLSALASSPDIAERFERFCGHFDIATSTAQTFMGFLAFFSVVVSGLSIWHALFGRNVLRQIKEHGIHNKKVEPSPKG